MSNNQLSARLAKAGAPMVPSSFQEETTLWYRNNKKRILALVGGQEERAALFIACAFAQVNKIPALLNCTPESFFSALIMSMGTNLLPGPSQECCIIPFKSEATFIPMYQGLVKLVYNSGFVTRISGHVVWEADQFDYDPADEKIFHRPFNGPEKERGKRIAAYSVIKNIHGQNQPMVKYAEFIDGIKARSRGASSPYSPWNSQHPSDVDAMWLKTVFKQAAKWVPKATTPQGLQFARAIELDNAVESGEQISVSLLADGLDEVRESVLDLPARAEVTTEDRKKTPSFFPVDEGKE